VLVENAHRVCSVTSEIAATIAEEAFGELKKPIQRLAVPDVHVPFSPALEKQLYPTKERIMTAVSKLL
jgi:acetoin:2,6-dichlorophenolindophenol oxidoreductase subunit beta